MEAAIEVVVDDEKFLYGSLPLNATHPGWCSVYEKWLQVGSQPTEVAATHEECYAWENPREYCGTEASQKLRWIMRLQTYEEPYARYNSMRYSASEPTLPSLTETSATPAKTKRSRSREILGRDLGESLPTRGLVLTPATKRRLHVQAGSALRPGLVADAEVHHMPDLIGEVDRRLGELRAGSIVKGGQCKTPAARRLMVQSKQPLLGDVSRGEPEISGQLSPGTSPVSPGNADRRHVALSEFTRWCLDKFGSVDQMLRTVFGAEVSNGIEPIPEAKFIHALKGCGYPFGDIGAKMVFKHLDLARSGILSAEDVRSGLLDIFVARTDVPTAERFEETLVEAPNASWRKAAFARASKSSLETKMQEDLKRINEEDATVGQFLNFLLDAYASLQMAFRALDITGSEALTMTEFHEGLKSMRARDGSRPLAAHVANLWSRLSYEGGGMVLVEDLIDAESNRDAIVSRFGKFLLEAAEAFVSLDDKIALQQWIERTFGTRDRVGQKEFYGAVSVLHYTEWHVNDLFSRLDKDQSGNLSFEEFSSFLALDLSERKKPYKLPQPLGDHERRRKLRGEQSEVAASAKLAESRQSGRSSPNSKRHAYSELFETKWQTESFGMALNLERPDVLTLGRKLKRRGHLHQTGEHLLSGSSEKLRDLAMSGTRIGQFDDLATRTRIEER